MIGVKLIYIYNAWEKKDFKSLWQEMIMRKK